MRILFDVELARGYRTVENKQDRNAYEVFVVGGGTEYSSLKIKPNAQHTTTFHLLE